MEPIYKLLTEWNPKMGDVFKSESGLELIIVAHDKARITMWGDKARSETFKWFGAWRYTLVSRANPTTETDMTKPFEVHTETKADDRTPYAWVFNDGGMEYLMISNGLRTIQISNKGVFSGGSYKDEHLDPHVTHRYYEGDTVKFTLSDTSEWFNN